MPQVLPESARAVIDDQKLSGYLLKQDHPGNGGKAAFFLNVAALGRVVRQIDSAYGQKFVVDGWLRPKRSGSPQRIRTVWMLVTAGDAPRLVTAYPSEWVNH